MYTQDNTAADPATDPYNPASPDHAERSQAVSYDAGDGLTVTAYGTAPEEPEEPEA